MNEEGGRWVEQEDRKSQVEINEASVELTILMPCLNEAETLEVCIRKAQKYLEDSGISGEVLIADNGSTDGSIEIADSGRNRNRP